MKTIARVRSWHARLQQTKWLNRYTIAFSIFFVWISFFDNHNLIVQYQLRSSILEMEKQIEEYSTRYTAAVEEKELMETEKEKYAREKYLMHRPDEDVFIIERD